MELIHNWQAVLFKAWSVHIMAVVAVILGLEALLPEFAAFLPAVVYDWVVWILAALAPVARLLKQHNL